MENFLIITALVLLFFVIMIYVGYKTNRKKKDVKLILNFISSLIQKKNNFAWKLCQEGALEPEDKLEIHLENEFKDLILGLSHLPNDSAIYLYDPNPDDLTKKIYSSLKKALAFYKKEKDLENASVMFFREINWCKRQIAIGIFPWLFLNKN